MAAPAGETTTITRDVFGKPLAIARNGVTYDTLVYDANQQLCKRVANGVVSFYAWDGAGDLAWSANGANGYADASCTDVSPANAAGHVVTRTYDTRNRLATLAFPDGNGNQTWTYTPDGLPSEITTANVGVGTVSNAYLYDQRRLPISEAMTLAGQPTRTLGYGYDANAHLSTRVTPTGQTYLYTPDALGEATQLAINGGGSIATGITYLPDGHIGGYTLGNGIAHVLTENTRDLPSEIHDGMAGSDAEDLIYTYDADANPTLISDNANGTRTATLQYDALDRLTYAAIAGIDANTPTNYSYNALDQLTEVQQGTHIRNYAYDTHYTDELTSIADNQLGSTAYTWDAQGNLASRAGQAFQFDIGNRLRGVIGSEAAYAYDADGRRVSQTSTGGSIESFYDHTGQLIWQRDRDDNAHDDLYLGGKLVAIEDFNSAGNPTGTRYQHTDALGSVVAQTASSGQVIAGTAAIYDAWGGVHGISMQDGPGYTGHVEDAATGLVYMQQRYYDPNVGRFLSMDPVEADGKVGGNLDRYWYANDNPYRYTDPTGMCTGSNISNSDGTCASSGDFTTQASNAHLPGASASQRASILEFHATDAQRSALSHMSYQSARTGDDGIENKFYMNDAGKVLGKSQSGCSGGGDNCTVTRSELPAGTTLLGHTHVYPPTESGSLPRLDIRLTREYPGPGDASPLQLGLTSAIVMPSGAKYLIEGTVASPHISYLGGGNAAFGAFVTHTWQPGMSTDQMLQDIQAYMRSQ